MKLIQCHNLFLRDGNWLYAIFIRKTNLILDLLNFNIFESREFERNGHIFINQLNLVLLKNLF